MNPPQPARRAELFLRLLEIVNTLRGPGGCPWDQAQTPGSIAPYLVEEAFEVQEAVESGDAAELCEELGDVLLEVALLAQMAEEGGQFSVTDSLEAICAKLVRRHPHVFAGEVAPDAAAVQENWARIKAAEKPGRRALAGVPRRLPALHRARRVSEKAAGVGFDWADPLGVLDKVEEELAELREALVGDQRERVAAELGDLLFALVNLGRHLKVDPEAALHGTTERFLARFAHLEDALSARGSEPSRASLEELEELWQRAKASTDAQPPAQQADEAARVAEPQGPRDGQVEGRPPRDQ